MMSQLPKRNLTQYAEYFNLKGTSYHKHFQDALKQCKRLLLNKEEVAVQLFIEPINAKDENAIVVQAEMGHIWHNVGYIPGGRSKRLWMHWAKRK